MKRQILVAILLLAIIVLAAMVSASSDEPFSVRSRGPAGARAFLRFLQEMGVDAREGGSPPSPTGTFFLFHDLRESAQVKELEGWMGRGGRIVVASPVSPLASGSGIEARPFLGPLTAPRIMEPDCPMPEMAGVRLIQVSASDLSLVPRAPRSMACFTSDIGALVAITARGRGSLVVLGGPSLFINRNLHRQDNAVLALNLVRRNGPVVFGPPIPPGSQTRSGSVWAALPLFMKILVIQVMLAAVLFALVRARRLGKPVLEEAISPLPASELVRATAELYRGAHATSFAARLIRSFSRRRLSKHLGLPATANEKAIDDALSKASGIDEDRVSRLMNDRPIASDEELMELSKDLQKIADEMKTTRI